MCPPGWRALRKKPQFFLPILNLFFFLSLSLLSRWSSEPSLALSHFSKSIFSLNCSALSQFSAFSSPMPRFFIYILVKSLSALCAPTLTFISFFPPQSLYSRQTGRNTLDKDIRFPLDPTVKSVLEPIRGVLTYSMRSHLSHSLYCELHREREFIMTDPCCVFAGIRRSHVNKTEKSSTVSHRHEKEALLPAWKTTRRPIGQQVLSSPCDRLISRIPVRSLLL